MFKSAIIFLIVFIPLIATGYNSFDYRKYINFDLRVYSSLQYFCKSEFESFSLLKYNFKLMYFNVQLLILNSGCDHCEHEAARDGCKICSKRCLNMFTKLVVCFGAKYSQSQVSCLRIYTSIIFISPMIIIKPYTDTRCSHCKRNWFKLMEKYKTTFKYSSHVQIVTGLRAIFSLIHRRLTVISQCALIKFLIIYTRDFL